MNISVIPDPDGAWVAIVGGDAVLVIEANASVPIGELHASLRSEDATRSVLALLVSHGFDELPGFALVTLGGAPDPTARVVLRGPLTVTSGAQRISGGDVETWTEQSMRIEHELRISTPIDGRGSALPLRDGAAWAAQVFVEREPELELELEHDPEHEARTGVVVSTFVSEPAPATEPSAVQPPANQPPIEEHTIAEPQEDLLGYDHLFEATVVRSVEEAAVRPEATPDDGDAPAATGVAETVSAGDPPDGASASAVERASGSDSDNDSDDGDHDGLTVFSDRLGDVKSRARPHPSEIAEADASPDFWVRMPDGHREPLTGELLVGRAPTARVGDGAVPHLVTLPNDPDISRTHVKFTLEGDTVVVTDLHSRNGTSVVLPGKSPQLLRAGESATVIADTVVDLGGGTTMTVEQETS